MFLRTVRGWEEYVDQRTRRRLGSHSAHRGSWSSLMTLYGGMDYDQLRETKKELQLDPENIQAVVEIALALAGKPKLIPAKMSGIWPDPSRKECPIFHLPALKATPATRMMELLHGTDCRLGLITNGERWMLVDAPRGDSTGFASWYASLWLEEQITLRSFRSLLSGHRFFVVAAEETLEAMLAESAVNQQEVTEQLGYQVRQAVEVLVESIDEADQDRGRELT